MVNAPTKHKKKKTFSKPFPGFKKKDKFKIILNAQNIYFKISDSPKMNAS